MSHEPGIETDASCILIVDDEDDVRESMRDVVEMVGCTALTAASGQEALALLEQRRPCLVLLDLMMPGMTGAEVLEHVRRQPALANMTVVMSTSAPERAPRDVPILPKPTDLRALQDWIERTCRCS